MHVTTTACAWGLASGWAWGWTSSWACSLAMDGHGIEYDTEAKHRQHLRMGLRPYTGLEIGLGMGLGMDKRDCAGDGHNNFFPDFNFIKCSIIMFSYILVTLW